VNDDWKDYKSTRSNRAWYGLEPGHEVEYPVYDDEILDEASLLLGIDVRLIATELASRGELIADAKSVQRLIRERARLREALGELLSSDTQASIEYARAVLEETK
jgi:hypothetical protein